MPLYDFLQVVNRDHSSSCLVFEKTVLLCTVGHRARFAIVQDHPRSPRIFLQSPCSIGRQSPNCFVFEKTVFLCTRFMQQTDRQTDGQKDSIIT